MQEPELFGMAHQDEYKGGLEMKFRTIVVILVLVVFSVLLTSCAGNNADSTERSTKNNESTLLTTENGGTDDIVYNYKAYEYANVINIGDVLYYESDNHYSVDCHIASAICPKCKAEVSLVGNPVIPEEEIGKDTIMLENYAYCNDDGQFEWIVQLIKQ